MRPITLALSLQRFRSVPRPVVLDVQFSHSPGALDRAVPAFDRWVQTGQYCNPIPGSPLWVLGLVTRSLLSCDRWFLTPGAILKARSTGGVFGSLADRCSNPSSSMQGCPSSLSSPALLHKLQVNYKIPKFRRARQSPNRFPHKLQKTID